MQRNNDHDEVKSCKAGNLWTNGARVTTRLGGTFIELDKGTPCSGKGSTCNAGDPGLIPQSARSHRVGNDNPLHVFLPGEFHGQRSLVGYSPWGRKELDTTE